MDVKALLLLMMMITMKMMMMMMMQSELLLSHLPLLHALGLRLVLIPNVLFLREKINSNLLSVL